MNAIRSRLTLLIASNLLLTGIFGCCTIPTPESALEGTWELVPSDPLPLLTKTLITFDCGGNVTEVTYTLADQNTVTWNDPEDETIVDGDQVYVSVTQFGQGFTFDGTLNSATVPTGTSGHLDLDLGFANVTVSLSQGEAALLKQ